MLPTKTLRAPLSVELSLAADVLSLFEAGEDLDQSLVNILEVAQKSTSDGARISPPAVKEFVYRSIRQLGHLTAISRLINSKPPQPWLAAMQKLVIAQLIQVQNLATVERNTAQARLVDQAIEAVKTHRTHHFAAGFLNATLRRFIREIETLRNQANQSLEGQYNYPKWWLLELQKDYPQSWKSIAFAGASDAPFTLRINQRLTNLEKFKISLSPSLLDRVVDTQTIRQGKSVIFSPAMSVNEIPGFASGWVSVQDAGAQLAADLLDIKDGYKVLDACAAPGGKTVHCLELADVDMTALDVNADRIARVAENLSRFRSGLAAVESSYSPRCQLKVADARLPSTWWDGVPFDRVIADVPCSASGIVRRHPDIRWRRQRGDLATFAHLQHEILTGLWPLVKPGGKLLYVTCSVFWEEGSRVIEKFLEGRRNVVVEPLLEEMSGKATDQSNTIHTNFGSYLQPLRVSSEQQVIEHDGFFFARLRKAI
jgi:16S rRNA (cytosine967-C5)-methyltransferase